jgi:hypothetical protein
MSKSLLDILNVGHGVLNPDHNSITGQNFTTPVTDFFSSLQKTINLVNQSKTGGINGPMVGICLRDEGRVSESGWIDETCWAAVSTQIVEEGSELDLTQVRVRVPELHPMLDIPKDLPSRFVTDKNHDIINQYPVFVSQFPTPAPVAGDLVWIDFQDRENRKGPIFLGVAEANSYSATSTGEESEPKEEFKGRKKKKTKINGRSSDTKSRVFVVGDSNTKPMTLPRGAFEQFYRAQVSVGDLFQKAKNGGGWGSILNSCIIGLEKQVGGFQNGDKLIIGSMGGNESWGSLFLLSKPIGENRTPLAVGGKFSKGSGYTDSHFESIMITNQSYEDTSLLYSAGGKGIKKESDGYKSFSNSKSLKKITDKLLEMELIGVKIIIFGPPIGGDPKRYLDRTFLDQLQQQWFDDNGIQYVSVMEASKDLIPNKDDVHYGRRGSSGYIEYFDKLLSSKLQNF